MFSACLSPELLIPDHIDTNLSYQHYLQFHSQSPSNLRFLPHSHDIHPNTRTALLADQQYISGILAQDFLRIHSVEFRVRGVGNRGCHGLRKYSRSAVYFLKIHNILMRSRECSSHKYGFRGHVDGASRCQEKAQQGAGCGCTPAARLRCWKKLVLSRICLCASIGSALDSVFSQQSVSFSTRRSLRLL